MKKGHSEKTELEKRLEAEAEAEAKAAQEEAGDESAGGETAPSADVAALIKERDDLADKLLRARAEFDNYRRRVARDSERARQMAAEALLRDILPVIDHLELALRHKDDQSGALAEGVEMTVKSLHEVLRRHGLEPIAAEGEPFNPEVHEAIMRRPSEEHPQDTVLEEFQRGYRLGTMVLRPTKVVVSHRPEEEDAESCGGQEQPESAEANSDAN
ncbi:MAG: nucleotide exchange factor GrpE [Candidatus Hydrogenedentes bacterium]|nr:nucleotide exchange factor GrpE [Candidatus Hydrogenedentota bacterium]